MFFLPSSGLCQDDVWCLKEFGIRKGQLKPIQVVVKVRQGRKACTLITGFEPFLLDPHDLADGLRRVSASSTSGAYNVPFSVSPYPPFW